MALVASYRGKRILLTGDTGFKGSWLATWLLHYGADVIGFALPPTASTDNYVVSGLATRYEHIDGDVRDHARLARLIAERQPEIVFHLAAQSLVLEGYAAPRETFDTNIMGTINVLDAARTSASVRAVIVVSSDKCYAGHHEVAAYRETDPMGGLDPYSASKGAAELAVAAMRHSYFRGESTAAVATARAGNVIGGGDWAKHRIVPDSIRALRDGVPITVRNPLAVRPWQHVLDALHGYLVLGARLLTDRDRFASGWNFGPT
ncbi:MAG: CDP-glucose 4,6-dehydratase, partial [Myxococcales bacterium]|nr:CDP-glucose 4,6-dehydratase [Myxococcales bacterium]